MQEALSKGEIEMDNVVVYVSDYGEYLIPSDAVANLSTDGRTSENKLRRKYEEALNTIIGTAFYLDVHPADIFPTKRRLPK